LEDVKKKKFVKPKLIKFDKSLDEVTLCNNGSYNSGCGQTSSHKFCFFKFW
jgi:hypothetical protein